MFTFDWVLNGIAIFFIAVVVLVGIASLIVTAIYHYSRLRGRTGAMRLNTQTDTSGEAAKADRARKFIQAREAHQDALGWSTAEDEADSAKPQGHLTKKEDAISDGEKTILIADDDPVVVFALMRRLQQLGFQVIRSPDAAHALMGIMKVKPDLVILDIYMPSGNGLAVCEMMASDPHYSGIPVIIHSILGDEATKERTQRLGAHYVEKSPQSWAQIKALVETLIGKGGGEDDMTENMPEVAGALPEEQSTAAHGNEPVPASPATADMLAGGETVAAPSPEKLDSALAKEPSDVIPQPIVPVCGHARVLCIDGLQGELELFQNRLSALGVEVTRINDLEEGFWTCFTNKPHVVVIRMAGGDKKLLEILHRFVSHPFTRNFPVIFINQGNEIPAENLPVSANFKALRTPIAWNELFQELEKIIPIADLQKDDPLVKTMYSGKEIDVTDAPASSAPPLQSAVPGETSLKILCIDDDPVIVKSIAARLKPYAIEVKEAHNGTTGYLQAISDMPDIILLDLQMPHGDGHYVLAKLKEHSRTKDIPVIMLTVETHPGVRRQMLGLGAAGFLSKPVHWREFFAEIGRHVQLPDQLIRDYHLPEDLFVPV